MRRFLFILIVKFFHRGQKRKYTNEPYWTHPYAVGKILKHYGYKGLNIEIAYGHDLFEDTSCTYELLVLLMRLIGYSKRSALCVADGILDLSDVYTKEKYPSWNRKKRKQMEAERLALCSADIQTIKIVDLIHNRLSIFKHDPGFSKTYQVESYTLYEKLDKADSRIRNILYSAMMMC